MSLIYVILMFVVVGVVMYFINKLKWMDKNVKNVLNVVVVIFLEIWLLQAFGFLNLLTDIRIGTDK